MSDVKTFHKKPNFSNTQILYLLLKISRVVCILIPRPKLHSCGNCVFVYVYVCVVCVCVGMCVGCVCMHVCVGVCVVYVYVGVCVVCV